MFLTLSKLNSSPGTLCLKDLDAVLEKEFVFHRATSTCFSLITHRIYFHLHSFTQLLVYIAFDMHRFSTTLVKKLEGTTWESRGATITIAGYPRGTVTNQVWSVSYLVLPVQVYNGL